ncbi:MAG: hypothetical protein IPO00_09485 [Betaproteobacteria bacterium]|nr:hypothetical protein [Betaproteobacteria bacterium]
MFDRIQHIFERLVGAPATVTVPLAAFYPKVRLPEHAARPACWRRHKRVTVWRG